MRALWHRGRTALPSAPASLLPALAAALVVLAIAPPASAAGAGHGVVVRPRQELAILLASHAAMSAPSAGSAVLQLVDARRPITGETTVLPVLGRRLAFGGVTWLHVRLPGRPNGRTGWIRRHATVAAKTEWHIVVEIARRRVVVYRNGRVARVAAAVVGKPSTPTPTGEFFVEEAVELRASDVGAPFALALSARSGVFQEFDGGPGQIALHGLANVGGVLGTAASHGCVRLGTGTIRWLVARIGPGTPVTIKR